MKVINYLIIDLLVQLSFICRAINGNELLIFKRSFLCILMKI